ncbi:hypothetical protein M5689_017352 [Euphorbia peplus]|nr:hypothetical protein M5689_017352 [Euphorbia peplus]
MMNLSQTTTASGTTLSLILCFSVLILSTYIPNWSAAAAVLVGLLLIVVAARLTMVAWITVLVLLAFAGNRRRVLVQKGRKITTDVIINLFKGSD